MTTGSIIDQNPLDEFISLAKLSNKQFIGEKEREVIESKDVIRI